MNGEVIGIPTVIVLTVAIVILLTIVAFRTKLGRYLYAIGGGEPVAAVSGVPVARYKIFAFVLGGVLCGIAGVFITGQVGAGTADVGSGSAAGLDRGRRHGRHGTVGRCRRPAADGPGRARHRDPQQRHGHHRHMARTRRSIVKGLVIIAAVALSMDRSRATGSS